MKFCSKCGKEIHDEAVICVYCGCSTEPSVPKNTHTPEHNKLMSFVNEAKSIYIFGILSIVLCLGIGIVFQIINILKLNKYSDRQVKALVFPKFELTDSADVTAYEDAKKKIKLASTLTGIGFGISIAVIFLCFWFGIVMPAFY
ncbi:MAG: hypothetical protein IJB24_05430 [Clostridia bacterium]|nr:hypothetical protein [Clostridia bacterium]MBQ4602287.1 hypothetical protein [Clostridia bacterium]